MTLVPLGDYVIIEPIKPDNVTKGGIVLPDTARDKPTQGKVVAVGKGKRLPNGDRATLEVEPDQIVLYSPYAGSEARVKDKVYRILSESEVLAIVKEEHNGKAA